jgi:hypothetical protein
LIDHFDLSLSPFDRFCRAYQDTVFAGSITFFRKNIISDKILADQGRTTFFEDVSPIFITKVTDRGQDGIGG